MPTEISYGRAAAIVNKANAGFARPMPSVFIVESNNHTESGDSIFLSCNLINVPSLHTAFMTDFLHNLHDTKGTGRIVTDLTVLQLQLNSVGFMIDDIENKTKKFFTNSLTDTKGANIPDSYIRTFLTSTYAFYTDQKPQVINDFLKQRRELKQAGIDPRKEDNMVVQPYSTQKTKEDFKDIFSGNNIWKKTGTLIKNVAAAHKFRNQ